MSGGELYIYWHCSRARSGQAVAAAQALQAALRGRHPGLQARVLQRADEAPPGDRVTLMEIYARPGGLDAATREALRAATAQALAAWADGPRHVEIFEDLALRPGAAD
ncbi:MAG: DUF4936 family protein [Rubrivivax sp.]|nr:DUF4936 family protein [Rubrivivax sp.]